MAHQEFSDGSGLEMYEFKWRMDDPQTGRFWQIDPLADKYEYNSPYAFSENKVTSHVELEGLEARSIKDMLIKAAWNEAGISSSSDPIQFSKNVGKELLKPRTWIEGTVGAGQIAIPVFLTSVFTGGFGTGAVLDAEAGSMSLRSSSSVAPIESPVAESAVPSEINLNIQPKATSNAAHSVYSDGLIVREGEVPKRLGAATADPLAKGSAHTRLRMDIGNGRVYQGREFNSAGNPVRDIDFTSPTFPGGQVRPGHPTPHQHLWVENPTGGSMIRSKIPIPFPTINL